MVNLKEVGLIGNKLTKLPNSFTQCVKLEVIHIEGNRLAKLPKGFGDLVELKKVYMQDNQLPKVVSGLGRCEKLEVLNAENNKITSIAKRLACLPKIKYLLLAGNEMTSLPFDPRLTSPALRRLTLHGNKLNMEQMNWEMNKDGPGPGDAAVVHPDGTTTQAGTTPGPSGLEAFAEGDEEDEDEGCNSDEDADKAD